MKRGHLLFTLMLLFFAYSMNAQESDITRCGADELHAEKMKDPEYAQKFNLIERLVKEQSKYRSPSCANPIILPVAVHWNGGITNANMACLMTIIDNQIDILNEDFGGYNTDIINYCNHSSNCPANFPPNVLGGGSCIQFCIATQNHPAGEGLSNGNYAMTFGQYDFSNEAAPWAGYVNFFVSDVDPPGYNNLLGLAPLSGGASPDGNGIFVTNKSFGGDNYSCTSGVMINQSPQYGLGRTATHEAGHYFGLPHVFSTSDQNPTPPADCSSDNDNIADTPLQSWANYGVHAVDYNTCESNAHNTCGTQDFFFDFMDYGDDQVLYMFTSDQTDKINTIANLGVGTYKTNATSCVLGAYSPTYPTGCPVATPPESAFNIDEIAPYEFCPAMNEISFTDASTGFPSSWAWTFSGAGVTESVSTDQNPTIHVNSSGTLMVTLTASNNSGPDATPATMSYTITILPAAQCGNCGETFLDSGGNNNDYGNNEDMTWTFCAANPGDKIVFNFSTINFGGAAFEDKLLIKNGTVAPVNNGDADYVGIVQSLYVDNGGGSYGSIGNIIIGTESCMSFRFLSNGTDTGPGWEAIISCLAAPTCTDGLQNQDEEFIDCGGATCPTCPTPCEGFTFYDAGGTNDMALGTSHWQMCADNANETVTIDFTSISVGENQLFVWEGADETGQAKYLIQDGTIFTFNGSTYSSNPPTTSITSPGQCFSLRNIVTDDTETGWVATVSSNCVLPVTLVSFDAKAAGTYIDLDWSSASEINSDRYEIERREDNGSFEKIGTESASGSSVIETNYNFTDYNVVASKLYYYRLNMIDKDGSSNYSNVVHATTSQNQGDWTIFPNPGKGQFAIDNIGLNTTSIVVIDKLGREVYRQSIKNNNNTLQLSLDQLGAGYYQLVLIGDNISSKPLVVIP